MGMDKGVPFIHIVNAVETVKRDHALEIHPIGCRSSEFRMQKWSADTDHLDAFTDARVQVVRISEFSDAPAWDCYASIEMIYSSKGYRAVYGIKPDGTAECWMN